MPIPRIAGPSRKPITKGSELAKTLGLALANLIRMLPHSK